MPLDLIKDCFTRNIETQVIERVDRAAAYGDEELKQFEVREELGVLGIICGTFFKSTCDLYSHCETMHRISTVRLNRAVAIEED